MSEPKKPVSRITLHPVSAGIWRDEGEKGAFYAVTFERSYRDAEGDWKTSASFAGGELLLVAKVADLAHSEVVRLRAEDKAAQPVEE